jgi:ribosomal protein S27E
MEALDGNAVAGQLMEIFGHEMTTAVYTCGTCGAVARVAETVVYMRAPGTVMRCRSCGTVLIAFTAIRGVNCVDLEGLADLRLT